MHAEFCNSFRTCATTVVLAGVGWDWTLPCAHCAFLLATLLCAALAESPRHPRMRTLYHAGISRITVSAGAPLRRVGLVPDHCPPRVTWDTGSFTVPGDPRPLPIAFGPISDCAAVARWRSVGGGNPLILSELSSALARQGFVVIAPFHGTSRLLQRPFQIRECASMR